MAQRKRRRGRHAPSRGNKTNRLRRQRLGSQGVRSLSFEPLEDRRMLALFVVNDLGEFDADDNLIAGSLRNAVLQANINPGFDTIIFGDFLFNGPGSGVISLDAREGAGTLLLTDPDGVQILGPGAGVLTVFAPGGQRVFLVDDGNADRVTSVTISGLTLSGGSPAGDDEDGRGGAILNREALTLREVEVYSNSAPSGGGAIFNDVGSSLRVERSLIRNNFSGAGGGGIQNGIVDEEENLPTTTIVNSTITGNTASGAAGGENSYGGGGVLNLAGTVSIEQSTIFGNSASAPYSGGGVASQGFDAAIDDMTMMPANTSGFATTNIRSSIIVGNTSGGAPDDVGSLGMTEGDTGADPPVPAMPFEPQINSLGFNLFGVLSHPSTTVNPAITLPPGGPGDMVGIDPLDLFIDEDPTADPLVPLLGDFGGVLPVFMPDINKAGGLMAIDRGDPMNVVGPYDQRGSQFERAFDATGLGDPIMDIGAAEVQAGSFEVNTLVDEADGRYGNVPISVGTFPFNFLDFDPDLSLRESLEFAQKNALAGFSAPATVTFSGLLTDPIENPDPTLGTPPPTILLSLGELFLDFPVIIDGPSFDLEIDSTGNDLTPGLGRGSRVFSVFDTVDISNLILRGGNSLEFGGAIFTSGDLIVRNITLLDNHTAGSGGAIHVAGGTLLVDSTTIHSNTSAGSGGGIFVASGDVTVSNSTITGNTAALHGGGIANADGNLTIQYSTITLNTSGVSGGVATYRDAYAVTQVRSTIISGNTVNDVQLVKLRRPGAVDGDFLMSLDYNLVGVGNAVFAGLFGMPGDQVNITDPMLGPLSRLGGPTPVHRLLAGSPAINKGDMNPAGISNVPAQDQRGFPFDRIEMDGINRIDIGAFETQDGILFVGDVTEGASFATFVEALDESNLTPTFEQIIFLPSWIPEFFPSQLAITNSVGIFGDGNGFFFFGNPTLEILIDDGNNASLLDVSIDSLRFQNNVRIVSRENLTLSDMRFVNNSAVGNGGAVSQQFGKLTIADSTFIGNTAAGSGGAIHVLDGDLEINNSLLTGNSTSAGGSGGAIYIRNGNFTADYSYITGNSASTATGDGGGVYAQDATLMFTDVTISGNSTSGSDSEGGGLAAKDSDITLIRPAFSLNTTVASQSRGGGLFLDGGSLNIQSGNFFGNKTNGQFSSGGGISTVNADVTITGTSINFNEVLGSDSDGGGIYAVGGNLTVRDSAVINNLVSNANSDGGGIYSDGDLSGTQTTSIINSTISGNTTAGSGGGFFNAGGLAEIKHSTITDNDVPYVGDGGGVGSNGDSSTTRTEVYSSIISGNLASTATAQSLTASAAADFDNDNDTDGSDFLAWQRGFGTPAPLATLSDGDADSDQDVDNFDLNSWESGFGTGSEIFSDVERVGFPFDETFLSLGYNLIGEGLSVGVFDATGDQTDVTNPMLGPLANNGGPTLTHALLAGSPAIEAGDPAFNPASITPALVFDQRGTGFDRVQGQIDIGAYEVQPAPLLASVSTEPLADVPLAASASIAQPLIVESQAETPLRATTAEPNGDEFQGIASLLTRLHSQVTTSFQPTAPRFSADALTPYFDELEAAARDASTARLAHLSEEFGQFADDIDVGSLAAALQSSGSADETVVEDLVFEALGEEVL